MPYTVQLPNDVPAAPEGSGRYTVTMPAQESAAPSQDVERAAMFRSLVPQTLGGKYSPDMLMGMKQLWDSAAQMLARTAGAGPGNSAEVANQETLDAYNKYLQPDATVGKTQAALARGAGQALVTAPFVPALKGAGLVKSAITGAGQGGLGAAMEPVYDAGDNSDYWSKLGSNVKKGAAIGGAIGSVGNIIGRTLSPNVTGETEQALKDSGIRLTPGQSAGGIWKGVEDWASGFPVIKEVINRSRVAGIMDFNKAIYAKALEPFGEEGAAVLKAAPVGREGIAQVGDFLSQKYQSVLPKISVGVDEQFATAMGQLRDMAKSLPDAMQTQLDNIVQQQLAKRGLTVGQQISGETMKAADSELGRLATGYKGSSNFSERELGDALRQVQANLREMVARQNPDTAPIVRAADEGWRTLTQMENAGAAIGARNGVFSPAQFLSAGVKKSDKTIRDRAFARGEAWNQDLAEKAKTVMTQDVPDTGSGGRAALAGGVYSALTGGLGAVNPAMAVPALTLGGLYTLGMTKGGQASGDLIKALAPYLSLPAGAAAVSQ